MVQRKEYLDQLLRWKERKVIKVVTGVRRCGKSTLLQLFQQELIKQGVEAERCIAVNFEDLQYERLKSYHALYAYLTERLTPDKMNYIFLDEIQLVPDYQIAVDSLFLRDNVDIYLTGSNAHILSGELATMLSGRYVEISMLPLSFREYYEVVGGDKRSAFASYYQGGGFPYAASLPDAKERGEYLRGIYSTVLLKDIVERKHVTDVPLLESIIRYLADNIGNVVSVKRIADALTSGGRKTTTNTVDSYMRYASGYDPGSSVSAFAANNALSVLLIAFYSP